MTEEHETRYCAVCDSECEANPDYLLEVTTPVGDVIDVFCCEECYDQNQA